MYFGEAHTVLDDKGRITIPRRLRETMAANRDVLWFMTRGYDGCVFLFPQREWDRIRQRVQAHPSMSAQAIDVRRMVFGGMTDVQADKQGRMMVPSHLRQHAALKKEVVLVGVDDHLELWSQPRWETFQKGQEDQFKHMTSALFSGSTAAMSEEQVE